MHRTLSSPWQARITIADGKVTWNSVDLISSSKAVSFCATVRNCGLSARPSCVLTPAVGICKTAQKGGRTEQLQGGWRVGSQLPEGIGLEQSDDRARVVPQVLY